MGEVKLLGAELLVGETQAGGEGGAFWCVILGVSQHGAAQVGTVEPELMRPACEGLQLQKAPVGALLQQTVSGPGWLPLGVDAPEETGLGTASNGHVHDAFPVWWSAIDQAMVDFTQQALGVEVIEEPVDVGIFGQQHQAKGIPV